MSNPFDATLKELVGKYPADWMACLGIKSSSRVDVIDADLSTVTTQADKVLLIHDPEPWLLHIELQASRDKDLSKRILRYNTLLHAHHGVPVHSTVFLLRPEAIEIGLTGQLSYAPSADGSLNFRFQVLKVWQHSPEEFLSGGIGTLPLAPLCDVTKDALPHIIHLMDERLSSGTMHAESATIRMAAFVLLGLRYEPGVVEKLFQGVKTMEESSTYQAILAKGEARGKAIGQASGEARMLLIQGTKRWGPVTAAVRAKIESSSVEVLERLGTELLESESWEDLIKNL